MKNLITLILATLITFTPISAFAHGKHIEQVAGHAHSLNEIIMLSSVPVIAIIALIASFILVRKNHG